jgi:hypothetical protein
MEQIWFLAEINRVITRKTFFWATFVEDQQEYRIPFYPKQYGKEWAYVRKSLPPSPSY